MPIALGVYIAAPFQLRHVGQLVLSGLLSVGLYSTARWLDQEKEEWKDDWARIDLDDIDRSTVVILINPPEWAHKGTGGRHVEFGYALARHKDIIVFGERTNIFHHVDSVHVVSDLTSVIEKANDLARGLSLV